MARYYQCLQCGNNFCTSLEEDYCGKCQETRLDAVENIADAFAFAMMIKYQIKEN